MVDGVPHTPLQGPGFRGCQERVTQVTEGHVIAVQVMEEGVRTWSKTGRVLKFWGAQFSAGHSVGEREYGFRDTLRVVLQNEVQVSRALGFIQMVSIEVKQSTKVLGMRAGANLLAPGPGMEQHS